MTKISVAHFGNRAKKKSYAQYFLACLLLAILNSCTAFKVVSESLFMMSPEDEIKLGVQVKKQLEKNSGLIYVHDAEIVDYMQNVARKIHHNSPSSTFEPRFYVVKDSTINAFAIPGGEIFVHTGLINAADDEAELAGVIAHEIGHVVLRHSARNISHKYGLQLVEQIVLGKNKAEAAKFAQSLINSGLILKFGRDQEHESDDVAIGTLYRAGYHPLALISFFEKLTNQYGDRGPVATLFASHPNNQQRVQNAKQRYRALPKKQYERPINDLRRVKNILRARGLVE